MTKYLFIVAIISTFLLVTACAENEPGGDNPPFTVTPEGEAVATVAKVSTQPPTREPEAPVTVQTIKPTLPPTSTPAPTFTGTPVPTATPEAKTPTPTDSPEVIEVSESTGVTINVRSGPGTNYPVVGQLAPGEAATVTGYDAGQTWWQIALTDESESTGGDGWVYSEIVEFSGDISDLAEAEAPPTPIPPTPATENGQTDSEQVVDDNNNQNAPVEAQAEAETEVSPEELADSLRCGKDFCITYQAMVPIWENGGCIGNHSIYVTVLEGPPPGRPLDGIVLGDTFGNVEVASGSKGPGVAEFTLWMNSMSVKVKRHIDGREFTSEESFSFTSHDELIPAELLAANGYCDGSVEKCREAQQQNQICRGHYSWRVTFHKFD